MLNHQRLWSLEGLARADVLALIDSARALRRAVRSGAGLPQLLRGKHVALLSDDHTSAAACEFHRAAAELGAQMAHIRATDPGQPDRRDPRDTAGLLGQLYDAIECQGLHDEPVRLLDRHARISVYNGIGCFDHPTRVIADLMTLQDLAGKPLEQLCLHFIGDPHGPAGRALATVAAAVGVSMDVGIEPAPAARQLPAFHPAAHAAVLEETQVHAVCEAGDDGQLPLRLLPAGAVTGQDLLQLHTSNQRYLLQALLGATIL